jgi:hypothetical protein
MAQFQVSSASLFPGKETFVRKEKNDLSLFFSHQLPPLRTFSLCEEISNGVYA